MLFSNNDNVPISMWHGTGRCVHSTECSLVCYLLKFHNCLTLMKWNHRMTPTSVFGTYHSLVQHLCSASSKHHQVILLQSLSFLAVHDAMAGNRLQTKAAVNHWTLEQHTMQNHHYDVNQCHSDCLPAVSPAAAACHHLSHIIITCLQLNNISINILVKSNTPISPA